jgi:hypothetical protein
VTNTKRTVWDLRMDQIEADRHVLIALSTIERLTTYRRLLNDARNEVKRQPHKSVRLSQYVAERAFETEKHLRVFVKEGIDTINELRDSGRLELLINESIKHVSERKGLTVLDDAIKRIKQYSEQDYHNRDTAWLDEYSLLLKERVRDISVDKGRLLISAIVGGEEREFIIEPTPRPGHLGRISAEDFFNPLDAGILVTSAPPVFVPNNCHHQQLGISLQPKERVVDIYGNLVGSLAYVREAFYRHARKTKEVGLGAFTGKTPEEVVTIGTVISVYGLAMVIIGSIQNAPDMQRVGGIAMLVGIVLIIGGLIYANVVIAVSE